MGPPAARPHPPPLMPIYSELPLRQLIRAIGRNRKQLNRKNNSLCAAVSANDYAIA
jgi:hypothetical protein